MTPPGDTPPGRHLALTRNLQHDLGVVGARDPLSANTDSFTTVSSVRDDPLTLQITRFLAEIGIAVRWMLIEEPTQVPGIKIDGGALLVDPTRLQYPGDLLHEAGHLAVIPLDERAKLTGDAGPDPAREMMAMAWSYAALRHLGLDLAVVFHAGGYGGGSSSLIANFESGRYVAVPLLQWLEMAADPTHAAALGIEPYPRMRKWLL